MTGMTRRFAAARLRSTARTIAFLMMASVSLVRAQTKEQPLTIRVANQAMERWPNGRISPKGMPTAWGFELGIVLAGINAVWSATKDPTYLNYIEHAVDQFVEPD